MMIKRNKYRNVQLVFIPLCVCLCLFQSNSFPFICSNQHTTTTTPLHHQLILSTNQQSLHRCDSFHLHRSVHRQDRSDKTRKIPWVMWNCRNRSFAHKG
ncbi:hypothetical protein QVD17_38394 [Tagetes erecta]|uniref:Uncharacterized protein n=1 Tax=Tagetes erecta TaxID=13708 RepID=A0AAD8NG70_TARER|nr:hypothetical protein QVD17_38394 [Tagetes erecta]